MGLPSSAGQEAPGGRLMRLQMLYLHSTNLLGTLPLELGNLKSLRGLGLYSTQLNGTLPSTVGELKSLHNASLRNTRLSGRLPEAVGSLTALEYLDLGSTMLEGTLPRLDGCTHLTRLDVHGCALTALPRALPRGLTHLYLDGNPINATANQLAQLLLENLGLQVLDVGLFSANIVLAPHAPHWTPTAPGTRVFTPTSCVVGGDCEFRLDLYDDSNAAVHVGWLVRGLELGLHTASGLQRTLMWDLRNGSVLARVPASWIQLPGRYTFKFYHNGNEFKPVVAAANVLPGGTGSNCSHVLGHDDEGDCPGLRTVEFRCPSGAHAHPATFQCVCDKQFEDVAHNSSTVVCRRHCVDGRMMDREGANCTCPDNTYDVTATGIVLCVAGGVHDPTTLPEYHAAATTKAECMQCPSECAMCAGGVATLKQGWRLSARSPLQLAEMIAQPTTVGGLPSPRVALRCPSAAYDAPACPELALLPGAVKGRTCLGNHTGVLCAICAADFSRKSSDNSCESCSGGSNSIRADFGLSAAVFGVVVLTFLLGLLALLYWQRARLRWAKHEMGTNLRIVLGLLQVLALLKDVLSLVFPPGARHAFGYAALLTADVQSLVRFDCLGWTWPSKWLVSVLVVPSAAFAVVAMRWAWQRRTDAEEARANASGSLFFRRAHALPTGFEPHLECPALPAARRWAERSRG
eukprot:COSAG01_NODE_1381_length_10520_cov_2.661710_16_plen_690_part_00